MIISCQCIPTVREVHVKRRIADNIVKRGKPVAFGVFVIRPQQSIVMYDIGQRVDEIIENQVQAQELVGLLGDVLGIDGAVAFADFVGQRQHQCARACGWVIHRHILCAVRYHDFRNDAGDGMWRIVFGVLTEILIELIAQFGPKLIEICFIGLIKFRTDIRKIDHITVSIILVGPVNPGQGL